MGRLTNNEKLVFAKTLVDADTIESIHVNYTNYKGVTKKRHIRPIKIWQGSTEWHPEECFLMTAYDIDKESNRDFKVLDFDFDSVNDEDIEFIRH